MIDNNRTTRWVEQPRLVPCKPSSALGPVRRLGVTIAFVCWDLGTEGPSNISINIETRVSTLHRQKRKHTMDTRVQGWAVIPIYLY